MKDRPPCLRVSVVSDERLLRPNFSIFIPAYNAGRHLESVLERIPRETWEGVRTVWVVNDGSTDDTASVIARASARWPKLKAVDLPQNRGYGGAVKEALRRVRPEGVDAAVCLHADGQYAPEEIPGLLRRLSERRLDILQGSRIASGKALSGGMPLYKYIAGHALTALENVVFRMKMTDYHSGYLLYGRRALEELPFDALSDGFEFDLEVIAAARARGMRIGEAAIPTRYGDEVSHLEPVSYGLKVLRVVYRFASGHYSRPGGERGE